MDICLIILYAFVLFIIIFFAVRLAINPLLPKPEEIITNNQDFGLVKLRDIGVLSDAELEEVIKIYSNKSGEKENYEEYKIYKKVVNELKEMGYYTDEQYSLKIDYLKSYFEVDLH